MAKDKQIKGKRIILAILLIFLLAPIIQGELLPEDLAKLKGYFVKIKNPKISIAAWFSGDYQSKKQDYINENIGFRTVLVRVYNQIYYSFYNKSKTKNVFIGKDNYLYEKAYITAYQGGDFVGEEVIIEKVYKLNKLTDTLKTKGIDLVVVLAPGKASFYPEFIPEYFANNDITRSNFDEYVHQLSKTNINVLNFSEWFAQMKDTINSPLFPKTGIHWSKYGEILAIDSLVKYFGKIRPQNKMPKFNIVGMEYPSNVRGTDDDVEKSLNLIFDIPDLEMAYPKYEIISDSNTNPPKVLTIADSYYWGMFNYGFSKNLFSDGRFWYYNKQIYPDFYDDELYVSDVNMIDKVEENDIIMLLSTDANLHKFAFGFIDDLYNSYFNKNIIAKNIAKKKRLKEIIRGIKGDKKWLGTITKKANDQGISLEKAIENDAKYIIWQENEKDK